MGDFGIKVTGKDTDLGSAQLKDQLLNTKWPFAKMDVTNPVAFQNFRIVFNNDPPYNADGSVRRTQIYSFKHGAVNPKTGAKIIPQFWVLGKNSNSSAGAQPYFTGGGQIAATTAFNPNVFAVEADYDNMYFYVDKWYDNTTPANASLVGTILNVRVYVFVDDLGF